MPHYHPGWQIAQIATGTLSYTILSGTVQIIRVGGAQETRGAGETTELMPGDTVVENPDAQHYGANAGSAAVEIYAASLFASGEPVAIPLPTGSPAATP